MVVIHNSYVILLAFPAAHIATRAYHLAMDSTGLVPDVTDEMCEEMITMQRDKQSSWPPYQANYGQSCWEQPSSENVSCPESMSRNAAIGSARGGMFGENKVTTKGTFAGRIKPIYETTCLPVFCGKRTFGYVKGNRQPRMVEDFAKRIYYYLPSPLNLSIPSKNDYKAISLATLENQLRTIAEWLLMNFFMGLPYCMVPYIAYNNMSNAYDIISEKIKCRVYSKAGCRIFPKGTLCNTHKKDLHDDDNGCISPSVWTNLIGQNETTITFRTTQFHISFTCSTYRFALFMGYVPHYTFVEKCRSLDVPNIKKKSPCWFLHSAYTKSIYKYMALKVFGEDNVDKSCLNILKKIGMVEL